MTKDVQQQGGTRETQDLYTGLERQITVDTSNWDLRLHDGVTAGGFTILNRDNADLRYQAKTPELDGFAFAPAAKGIVVRLSPGSYALREIQVAAANMSVTNPKGTAGQIILGLLATITSDHSFTGDIDFVQPITGDLIGDVLGNVTGDVVGDLTGNVTGNVTGNLTGNSAGVHTGDVDVRSATLQMDDEQIVLAWLETAILNKLVPTGVILAWSGDETDIPDTWFLCDGANGTPDLRDKFILGAAATEAHLVGGSEDATPTGTLAAGGAHTHSLTIDDHVLTEAEIPAHQHGAGLGQNSSTGTSVFLHGFQAGSASSSITQDGDNTNNEALTESIGGGDGHTHTGNTASDGSHAHTFTGDSLSVIPPFYSLCYIMKGA
jgi:hypothetical protein